MKAVVCSGYGGPEVLRIVERPTPVPATGELLVRVRATTVSSADRRVRSLDMPRGFRLIARAAFGFTRPRQPVLGTELAGDVVAVGSAVTAFAPGDAVLAFTGSRLGCHAEYRCVAAHGPVARMPNNLGYAQAAALCFGGVTMLDFFRRAALRAGERVLVNGAAGAVGTAAVQLARQAGARVTAVCSGGNAELVRSLGAAQVIDYAAEDFTRSSATWDVIVDTVGTAPFARCAPVLAPGGRLLLLVASLAELVRAPWQGRLGGRRVIAGPAAERREDVLRLRDLALGGHFVPVIDRSFPLACIGDAHAYVDEGHKRGSVVVLLGPQGEGS